MPFVTKIVSGGQTGVDRAALDVALALQIRCGGWCPLGRLSEDGPIPPRYPLRETESHELDVRTGLNVMDSDATLILTVGSPTDGTGLTESYAKRHQKPLFIVDLETPPPFEEVRTWIDSHGVRVLNVAGPRESHRPGFVYRSAFDFLKRVFSGG